MSELHSPHDQHEHDERHDPREALSVDDQLMLAQVKSVLAPVPESDRRHIAQILAATHNRKRTPLQRFAARLGDALDWWRFHTPPLARGASLAAAALTIGFVARGYVMRPDTAVPAATTRVAVQESLSAPAVMQMVDGVADQREQRVTTQFVLDARDVPSAQRVAIVGDFNDWNSSATPLTLDRGVWSITVALPPGRHVYAFVVNDDQWIRDPRAPEATDNDFGRPGSVIIVQAP